MIDTENKMLQRWLIKSGIVKQFQRIVETRYFEKKFTNNINFSQ